MTEKTTSIQKDISANTLKLSDLYSIGTGQAIGAGVLTLIGPAILLTGQSAALAYLVACIVGFFMIAPVFYITSSLKLAGGFYSLVTDMLNKKISGMFALGQITNCFGLATYPVAIGIYAHSLWPFLNETMVGVVVLSLFFIINIFGVNAMANAQKIMVVLLFISLGMFIVFGFFDIQNPVMNITTPNFFSNGADGFYAAVMLYVYSTNGYSCIMNYGIQAKRAKKDIPIAIFLCLPTLIVVYTGVAIVACGVLPLDQVANQPLTYVAQQILNKALFSIFMFGGPILALSSSINSSLANYCLPIAQSCKDGWLPKWLAKQNRYGAYWIIMTFCYCIGLVPLILGLSISEIVNNIMLLASLIAFIQLYACFKFPIKHAKAWKQSQRYCGNTFYYLVCTVSLITYCAILFNSLKRLDISIISISLCAIAICFIFGYIRGNSNRVTIQPSVWEE